jgi:hypothetical protein
MLEQNQRDFIPFPLKEQLHTDVLEQRYGPVHVEVRVHTDERRIADIVDETGISRTHAITLFPEWCDRGRLSDIDAEIRSGNLIGKTFRKHGYTIRKHVTGVFVVNVPEWLQVRFDDTGAHAKARTSEFFARKGDEEPLIYGYVTEIYTPDFRPAEINETDMAQLSATTEALEALGIDRDTIWKSIVGEEGIDFRLLQRAQNNSVLRTLENQKIIETYLATAYS